MDRQLVFKELETRHQVKFARRLGRGAFGEVYEARVNGVPCAVKISLDAITSADGNTAKELEALELVKQLPAHPHIVSLFDHWMVGGFLVTRWELGQQSLGDRLKECQAEGMIGIPRNELWRYLSQSALALDYLNHERGIFHRDVKPENLILFAGHVKLADLGMIKFKGASTGSDSVAGTPHYMSPEAMEGRLSKTSDLYSLAATYVILRTGCSPFGTSPAEVLQRQRSNNPCLDGLDKAERKLIRLALQHATADRPQGPISSWAAWLKPRLESSSESVEVKKAQPQVAPEAPSYSLRANSNRAFYRMSPEKNRTDSGEPEPSEELPLTASDREATDRRNRLFFGLVALSVVSLIFLPFLAWIVISAFSFSKRTADRPSHSEREQPPSPPAISKQIVEGVGCEPYVIGASKQELMKKLGDPEKASAHLLEWHDVQHVDCLLDKEGFASEWRFDEDFEYPLTSGLKPGATEAQFVAAYKAPTERITVGNLTRLTWTSRGLRVWTNVNDDKVTQIVCFRPGSKLMERQELEPAAKLPQTPKASPIIEGVGWGAFRIGASKQELLDSFGPPDYQSTATWLVWRDRLHIDCHLDQQSRAFELRFDDGFAYRLASGVGLGSTEVQIIAAYGAPALTTVPSGRTKKLEWPTRGLRAWINDGKVTQIECIPSLQQPQGVVPNLQRNVTLRSPYPSSYPGAPRNKISVQYAVMELLRQAGGRYDFQKSQANVGELARRWVTPNVVNESCESALSQILGPLGLTYELVGGEVVLERK
jgi:serine/threonine protein kinase